MSRLQREDKQLVWDKVAGSSVCLDVHCVVLCAISLWGQDALLSFGIDSLVSCSSQTADCLVPLLLLLCRSFLPGVTTGKTSVTNSAGLF